MTGGRKHRSEKLIPPEPPRLLTQSNSFKAASAVTFNESSNTDLVLKDEARRTKGGGLLKTPKNLEGKRLSLNRANIVRVDVLQDGEIDNHFNTQDSGPLGKGSYGTVTKVQDTLTGQWLALKTIDKRKLQNPVRLQREILIMNLLDHPSIMRLHSVFEDTNKVYLLMELCSGGELFQRVVKSDPISEYSASIIMKQLLSALSYTHSNRIMHRDVKLENVMYARNDGSADGPIKLIDWGFSAKYNPGQMFQSIVGTPYYVAPEVLKQYYNYRCDIWSAGVLMYILIARKPPFYGSTTKQILNAVSKGNFTFQGEMWNNRSSLARDLVRRLLTANPDERISAAEALHHPWFNVTMSRPKTINGASFEPSYFLSKVDRFRSLTPLQRMCITCIAQSVSTSDTKSIRELFDYFDSDGDGVLTWSEIIGNLQKCGSHLTSSIHASLDAIDTDGSGAIDWSEFVAVFMDYDDVLYDEGCLKNAYRMLCSHSKNSSYNPNDLPTICAEDVQKLLRFTERGRTYQHKEDVPQNICENLLAQGHDRTQVAVKTDLNYEEFVAHIQKACYPRRKQLEQGHYVQILESSTCSASWD